jgi:hypothetical protein
MRWRRDSLDYAGCCPTRTLTVAALARAALRRLDDAGRLDRETLLQAGRDILVPLRRRDW